MKDEKLTGYATYSRKDLLPEIVADVNRFIKFSTVSDVERLDHKIVKKRNMKYKDFLSHQ
ncbi:hypothetical protein [Peribacillus loiseleuriae]|uniref:hypothetical protein n=1 Tax=Peribacillus loiseleuriae TaxID=1679170 RepID=UPI003D05307A